MTSHHHHHHFPKNPTQLHLPSLHNIDRQSFVSWNPFWFLVCMYAHGFEILFKKKKVRCGGKFRVGLCYNHYCHQILICNPSWEFKRKMRVLQMYAVPQDVNRPIDHRKSLSLSLFPKWDKVRWLTHCTLYWHFPHCPHSPPKSRVLRLQWFSFWILYFVVFTTVDCWQFQWGLPFWKSPTSSSSSEEDFHIIMFIRQGPGDGKSRVPGWRHLDCPLSVFLFAKNARLSATRSRTRLVLCITFGPAAPTLMNGIPYRVTQNTVSVFFCFEIILVYYWLKIWWGGGFGLLETKFIRSLSCSCFFFCL